MIWPLLFGLIGAGMLCALGLWQVQRLAWKQDILAQIAARIDHAPVELPAVISADDRFLAVQVTGSFTGPYLRMLTSNPPQGVGYRIIAPLRLADGRVVMVDLGFVPERRPFALPAGPVKIAGNVHFPDDTTRYTPAPDRAKNIWFSRDVALMADELHAEPTFIVARTQIVTEITPLPVDLSAIPNNHLTYALTWFSLAVVWVVMSVFLMRSVKHRKI